MADVVVSAVLDQMATILKEQIQNEVNLVRGVDSEIESLSKELETVRNVLEDAERKQFADKGVKVWLGRLEDASYKIEDVLDEWQIALRKFQIQQQQSKNKNNKVCSFLTSCLCFKKFAVRHDIAMKIKNVKGNLDEILADKKRYGFDTSTTTTQPPLQRTTISSVDLAEVHGRDIDRDVVASKIFVTAAASPGQLEIVSIVGVGGVGKTTLAQLIFNDNRVKDCFQLSIWICVSDPFDVAEIVKKIVESVTGSRSPPISNQLEGLVQNHLKPCISGKKFLLVLDDVWTEDQTKWELLRNSLKSCCGIGSKILVTTRKENVAKTLDTPENGIHYLGVLSDKSCWLLLKRIALFGRDEEKYCENYKDIGMKIASKCKGLPLAVKTLGSLLRCKNNNSLEEWEKVLKSDIWKLEEAQIGIFPHLVLSYNELSPALKGCFSYCSVFPKDSEIGVKEVIGHWMALGYLGSDIGSGGDRDMELRGQKYFDNLAMRSFFQDFKKVGSTIYCFKLHDIVHDFAQFLRKNGTAIVEAGHNKNTSCQVCSPYELISQVKQYRTLFCDINNFDTPICGCLGSLRVLSLSGYSAIPPEIEKFIHLRWLDLSWNSHLPVCGGLETICNELYNLQTLLLRDCGLKEIPKGIGNLINLRRLDLSRNEALKELPREIGNLINLTHLDLRLNIDLKELPENICDMRELETLNISSCYSLSKLPQEIHRLVNLKHLHNSYTRSRGLQFPQGIAQLTCLRTLSEFRVGKDMGKLGWLKNLNLLGGSLKLIINLIGGLGNMEAEDARDGELRNKEHLEGLYILFDDEIDIGGVEDCVWVDVLDALQPHPNLQKLRIEYFHGSRLPDWIASPLNQVKEIRLLNFGHMTSILLPLGKLPCLEEMEIKEMHELRFVGREFLHGITTETTIVFPKLKELTFEECPNWDEWEDITAQEEDGKVVLFMPRLTELNIKKCNSLAALPHCLLRKVASSSKMKLDISGSTQLEQRYGDKEGSPWKSITHINPLIQLIINPHDSLSS